LFYFVNDIVLLGYVCCWCGSVHSVIWFVTVDAVLLHCGNIVDNIADICLWKINCRRCSGWLVFPQV